MSSRLTPLDGSSSTETAILAPSTRVGCLSDKLNFYNSLVNWAVASGSENKVSALKKFIFARNEDSDSITLSLAGFGLTSLPNGALSCVKFKAQLEEFSINTNFISVIPQQLFLLNKLVILDLNNNLIEEIPREIKKLTNLTQLGLSKNRLKSLPAEIGELSNLEIFTASHNEISGLPKEIGKLEKLRKIYLSHNQLATIPAEMGKLYLEEIYLQNNRLKEIPVEVKGIKELKVLEISENLIQ